MAENKGKGALCSLLVHLGLLLLLLGRRCVPWGRMPKECPYYLGRRDSSGCFWARLFSLERSGSDGLPCPWTRFEGQETMA